MAMILYLVIPCFNEEEVLPVTSSIFLEKILDLVDKKVISDKSRILYIDDGSKDHTWQIIQRLAKKDRHFAGIRQTRNRGHQNSLLAGLMEARNKCDITISLDCDGQDDINAVDEMIAAYKDGCDIVYGVRNNRDSDSFFKRSTAETYYKVLRWMGVEVVYNHADYRLISNRALEVLAQYKEVNLYLRGMIPLVGFKSTSVSYERKERRAGKTHYSLKKMLSLALNGITSFSIKPIRIITIFGMSAALLGFIGVVWAVIRHFTGTTVWGWSSIICIMCFMGGMQMLSIGVIGEYIGKIYLETKHRPRYSIMERTGEDYEKTIYTDY